MTPPTLYTKRGWYDQQCLESPWKRRSEVDLEQKNLKLTDSQNHSVGGSCSRRKEAKLVHQKLNVDQLQNDTCQSGAGVEIQSASDIQSNADFQKNQSELSCTFSADKKSDNGSKQHTFV